MKTISHIRSVSGRFSTCAHSYEENAGLQKQIAAELMDLIPSGIRPDLILEAGCGTGVLTRLLRSRYAGARIHAVDLSGSMITQCRRRMDGDEGIEWHTADISRFRTESRFGLIVSNCALHWADPIGDALENLSRLAGPGSWLAASLMIDGNLSELFDSRGRAAPLKPPLRRMPRTEEVMRELSRCGFKAVLREPRTYVKQYDSARSLLDALRKTGVTGGSFSRAKVPLTRSELFRLVEDYDAHYRDATGKVRATFRAVLILARKSQAERGKTISCHSERSEESHS